MNLADAVPNLLIGLREGLEAGLVVSILLAAVRASDVSDSSSEGRRRRPTAPIWLGVLGAVMMSASFATVLTITTGLVSSSAQEAIGGALSVVAVALVTGMVFWMRSTARTLSGRLRGEVRRSAALGAGALTITALFAVGREGLETTLFIWTAARASGSTVAPIVGAAVGLAIAVVLCWLLYRSAISLDLGTFFSRTGALLIIVAAGVLAYGIGDLQDAGVLPGARWIAFDLTGHVDPSSWWVTLISGVTELTPRMTVMQVTVWVVYLVVVLTRFLRSAIPVAPGTAVDDAEKPASRWQQIVDRRTGVVAAALILVPPLVAVVTILSLPDTHASSSRITVTASRCAPEWTSMSDGTHAIAVENKSAQAGEVNLDNAAGAVVAEIETLGPATTATMTADLGAGSYTIICAMANGTRRSATVSVSGAASAPVLAAKPITLDELTPVNTAYQDYAAHALATLSSDVLALRSAVAEDDVAVARQRWLTAQLDWERVGASYDSFGSDGQAVDGLPDGLPLGVADPGFTGLHRIEYGLYHGQSAAQLDPVVDQLEADIATVRAKLNTTDEAGDPTQLPLRVHEILEDALRDHLSGIDDQGSHTAYAATSADVDVTRTVLAQTAPLIEAREPGLVQRISQRLDALAAALSATRDGGGWVPSDTVTIGAREGVDAAIGEALETLSDVPGLLEVPPSH